MAREEEVLEGEVVPVTDLTALAVLTKAEIDANVATAKAYPRSIAAFRKEALELVTLTERIAEDCIFALPRGKENGKQKFIEGPSVRFSEMLVTSYGNCRSGARVVGEEQGFVISEGFFHDLEKNVAIKVEVKRRITDKNGKRYNADMIAVTGNAACSIARRNAALQGIPKAIWNEFYEEARTTAVGDAKTLVKKRSDMMAYFQKMNITQETIIEFLGVEGVEDIGLDELAIIKGIATGIKEGTIPIDKAFTVEPETPPTKGARTAAAVSKITEAVEKANAEPAKPAADPAPGGETKTCPLCDSILKDDGTCPECGDV